MAAKKKPKCDCKKAPEDAVALLAECRLLALLADEAAAAKEPAVAAPATEEAPARPSRPSASAAVPKRSSPTKRTRSLCIGDRLLLVDPNHSIRVFHRLR
jgi:hypothetical protein